MFTKFWDKLAEGLAGKWTAQALGPALAFWGGGVLAWSAVYGWESLTKGLALIDNPAAYLALAVGGLLLLAASTTAVEWLQREMLRLAEGYWPWHFRRLRFYLARRLEKQLKVKDERWNELDEIPPQDRTREQADEYARLDAELARYPVESGHLMPTRLGNLLRAAEEQPQLRYGLEVSVCWPRLWLLLPKESRESLVGARAKLDSAARFFTWGVLLAAWVFLTPWAVLVAVLAAVMAYWGMLSAAGVYGDLLCSAFDLYRFSLYEALHWPLPDGPGTEDAHGERLSEYLFRGTVASEIQFTPAAGDD